MGLSMNLSPVNFEQTMEDAFPDIDPGILPFGSRVLVQIRTAKSKSSGGIALVQETREAVQWNMQTAKVRAFGPLAFKNRTSQEVWPEGQWCDIGDFVRVPKYGGDKWERPIPKSEDMALFVIFNDLDLIGKISIDPRDIVSFV
jgi:co-chaperonin GroES (HSP10)